MRILVAEDDVGLREALVDALEGSGRTIASADDVAAARKRLAGTDLLVTDLRLPDGSGLALVSEARAARPGAEVIVMTAFGSIASAVEAMRRGARAYLQKPFEMEELLLHIREVEEKARLRDIAARGGRGGLVGGSPEMLRVYAEIDAAASQDSPVLVTGETGTGKELAARAVHDLSTRRDGPFVAVNVGALPRDLVESELFGHMRGAFTGAHERRRGRFSLAGRGTLFLDEVDSLPLDLQPKLLRAIETREIWPLGAERGETVDVRIIAATNAPIEERVRRHAFREDLYYRLAVLHISMPPLRERPEDVPGIARALLGRMEDDTRPVTLEADAVAALVGRPWPGNVRELANALERARTRAAAGNAPGGDVRIALSHIDPAGSIDDDVSFARGRIRAADSWAQRKIRAALSMHDGNVSETARSLRIHRTALIRTMKRLGIPSNAPKSRFVKR